jgi:hypothetical protein
MGSDMSKTEEKFHRAVDIVEFYNLAAKYGFHKKVGSSCVNCDQWIEGPYADCSKCNT